MNNPKKYISFSQLVSFESGNFYQEYVLGNKKESIEIDFGKKIAEGLASGSTEKDVEFLRMWIPEVDEREKELFETIEGVPIKSILDGWSKDKTITEYKTGKTRWTQNKTDKSDQLTIYSMLVWHKYKIHPRMILIWIPTMNNGDEIVLTGELPISFSTTRTIGDYGAILKRLKVAFLGINKIYRDI